MSADELQIEDEPLQGLLLLRSPVLHDHRGYFWAIHNRGQFATIPGLDLDFVQTNQTFSRFNVLRGLHYQLGRPQGKLVGAGSGEIFDVAVDLRRGSATFGRWFGVTLKAGEGMQLWVPPGFGHGFLVTSPEGAHVNYSVTSYYDPASERTVRWDDPTIAIEWPLGEEAPIVSEKDGRGVLMVEAEVFT